MDKGKAVATNANAEFPPDMEGFLPQDPFERERMIEEQRRIEQVSIITKHIWGSIMTWHIFNQIYAILIIIVVNLLSEYEQGLSFYRLFKDVQ